MRLPHHSTIAAYLALGLAVGGGSAVAATSLGRNTVGSTQIRDRSVRVRDLATTARPPSRARIAAVVTDTMTSDQVLSALSAAVQGAPGKDGAPGAQGPQGAQGPSGVADSRIVEATSAEVGAGQEATASAQCDPGEKPVGGGGKFDASSGQAGATMESSYPAGNGWAATFSNGPASPSGRAHAFVVCVKA